VTVAHLKPLMSADEGGEAVHVAVLQGGRVGEAWFIDETSARDRMDKFATSSGKLDTVSLGIDTDPVAVSFNEPYTMCATPKCLLLKGHPLPHKTFGMLDAEHVPEPEQRRSAEIEMNESARGANVRRTLGDMRVTRNWGSEASSASSFSFGLSDSRLPSAVSRVRSTPLRSTVSPVPMMARPPNTVDRSVAPPSHQDSQVASMLQMQVAITALQEQLRMQQDMLQTFFSRAAGPSIPSGAYSGMSPSVNPYTGAQYDPMAPPPGVEPSPQMQQYMDGSL